MIHRLIDAHYKYFNEAFGIRNTARFYSLAGELFGPIVINKQGISFSSSSISKDRIDQKVVKLVTYVFGTYYCYEKFKQLPRVIALYYVEQFAHATLLLSDWLYYLYDSVLLTKIFSAKPHLSPSQEFIRGVAQVIKSLSNYKHNENYYNRLAPIVKNKWHFDRIIFHASLISAGAEGLFRIVKSTMKTEAPMLQNCLLIAGIANTVFNYLTVVSIHYNNSRKKATSE